MSSTPLPTRERQRLETRSLILRVALDEIAAKGLAGATIEAIARKAGVTRPTSYAHFPRKEDFLLAFQARTEHAVLQALQRKRVDASIGADLVQRLADAIFGFLIAENEPREACRCDAHRMLDLLIEGATI